MSSKIIKFISATMVTVTQCVVASMMCLVVALPVALYVLHKSKVLGFMAGQLVLPAQNEPKNLNIQDEYFVCFESRVTRGFEESKTVRLSTKEFSYIDNDTQQKSDRYIIAFCPNKASYNKLSDFYNRLAFHTKANVIAFDYPNVGNSTGQAFDQAHLVEAGVAQVNDLIKKSIPESHMTLYGKSLGGAVSTLVARAFGGTIGVVSDRSFSTVGNLATSMVPRIISNSSLLNTLATRLNWNMDVASAYRDLPADNRMLIFSKQDSVINYKKASLFSAMKADFKFQRGYSQDKAPYKKFKKTCSMQSLDGPLNSAHNIDLAHLLPFQSAAYTPVEQLVRDQSTSPVPLVTHVADFVQRRASKR